jgi:hypothetical protein
MSEENGDTGPLSVERSIWESEPYRRPTVVVVTGPDLVVWASQMPRATRLEGKSLFRRCLWLANATLRFFLMEASEVFRRAHPPRLEPAVAPISTD